MWRGGKTWMQSFMSDSVTHLRLTEHLDTVLADKLQQLAVRQTEELVHFGHLKLETEPDQFNDSVRSSMIFLHSQIK